MYWKSLDWNDIYFEASKVVIDDLEKAKTADEATGRIPKDRGAGDEAVGPSATKRLAKNDPSKKELLARAENKPAVSFLWIAGAILVLAFAGWIWFRKKIAV